MTLREFYIERRKAELPLFVRVLRAIPEDRLDYRPHERSPSAEQLVWVLTSELGNCLDVVAEHKTERKAEPAPPLKEMIALFERRSNELIDKVGRMEESAWTRNVQLFYQGKVVLEQPAGTFLWFLLFDAIHHRGQLMAYLRPMGGKVPAVYGPSADERPGA